MIIPPDILKNILHKIETDIKSHARFKLCEDPETNIWSYYRTIKLTPVVLELFSYGIKEKLLSLLPQWGI